VETSKGKKEQLTGEKALLVVALSRLLPRHGIKLFWFEFHPGKNNLYLSRGF
jgi:hypothetical protein